MSDLQGCSRLSAGHTTCPSDFPPTVSIPELFLRGSLGISLGPGEAPAEVDVLGYFTHVSPAREEATEKDGGAKEVRKNWGWIGVMKQPGMLCVMLIYVALFAGLLV